MVSGDIAFRIVYILAFIGGVPLSSIGVLLAADDLATIVAGIGENYTLLILAVVAAVLLFINGFLMVRYPVPRDAVLGLRVGVISFVVLSIAFWGWLTYAHAYTFPVLVLSELYTIATFTFIDFLLAIMAILVALFAIIERM